MREVIKIMLTILLVLEIVISILVNVYLDKHEYEPLNKMVLLYIIWSI